MSNPNPAGGRVKWIDCAKAVAIIAVIVNHCYGLLYTDMLLLRASFFSVSLFVLLAGLSAGLHRKKAYPHQLKKVGVYYAQYAIATAVLLIYYTRWFVLETYITHVLNFSIQSPYYFWVFFFQLMLISPALLSWCDFCSSRRWSWLWHAATLLLLCGCSAFFMRYTYILPVHGGGQYLFGGTYIILYYLGILLSAFNVFAERTIKKKIVILIISAILWAVWLGGVGELLPFDKWLEPYYGNGFNPPSVQLSLYALLMLFLAYAFFSLLEACPWKITQRVVDFCAFIGRNTLYIFMYHCLVKDIIWQYFPFVRTNIWIMRISIFIPMIVVPAFAAWILKKISHAVRKASRSDGL